MESSEDKILSRLNVVLTALDEIKTLSIEKAKSEPNVSSSASKGPSEAAEDVEKQIESELASGEASETGNVSGGGQAEPRVFDLDKLSQMKKDREI